MCGFLLFCGSYPLSKKKLLSATKKIKHRGPDHTELSVIKLKDDKFATFTHFLLNVSGVFSIQPHHIYDQNKEPVFTLLFNGEIYNYQTLAPEAESDTQALAVLIQESGCIPWERLDGEYAILVYDHKNNILTLGTDQFMTKPVYVGWSKETDSFGVASYPSALRKLGLTEIYNSTPNSRIKYCLDNIGKFAPPASEPSKESAIYTYSLAQVDENYEHWEHCFLESVKNRALHGNLDIFVPLSSGYDSGAICLALNLLRIPYRTITINSEESTSVLEKRYIINDMHACKERIVLAPLSMKEVARIKGVIKANCENLEYVHEDRTLLSDDGSIGALRLAEEARKRGWPVCLSGCGADELISDYGFNGEKYYPHSEFGGLFPKNLDSFFPWKKFYGDSMRSYLFKDEFIFGVYGIEGRYPYLDVELTQAFLSLSSSLKNFEYKSPLAYFLKKYNYPFEANTKRGFVPSGYMHIQRGYASPKYQAFVAHFLRKLAKRVCSRWP
jgi:asparagine synthetase B (glutamine-hydrolysing)